jgi:hypothetical protein
VRVPAVGIVALLATASVGLAGVGDPQARTDHPWYPGELACSTFERLFKTQADLLECVTGRKVASDEDKALASWYWRNLNYFHCTMGNEDYWGKGPAAGEEGREYWSGLFGFGYGLCYSDHHQWHGEMAKLLGPCRARSIGLGGHTSFEVWLTGGPYGEGRWALLDHDISTVVFTPDGRRLLGLMEVSADMASIARSDRTRGFIPGGLHPDDPSAYKNVQWAGYTTGYAGPPPMVYLRAGETLRRYLDPGLDDGKTFAYWGINYNAGGIPGPQRDRTWVNQPEKMYKAGRDCGSKTGQARYANAVYTYKPDFASGRYKEGVIDESDSQVTFEWYSPYIVAAAPPAAAAKEQWGIYKQGCTGGLVVSGRAACPVEVSVDQGKTWLKGGDAKEGLDLTDLVKGRRQYWVRFGAPAKALAGTGLALRTVCQCAPTVIPHLKAGANRIAFEASGKAFVSAGPNLPQAAAHVVDGAMNSPAVTLELAAPRQAKSTAVYAAAHAASGAPPRPCKYNVDCSTDGGKTWNSVVKDWAITQREPEPKDWWSQTFIMGDAPLDGVAGPVRVRFTNTGGRPFLRAEAHLVYRVESTSALTATFAWKDAGQIKRASHTYARPEPGAADSTWRLDAGAAPQTLWVEYAAE